MAEGLSDYTAENVLQYITGNRATPTLPSVYLALFTAAPTSNAGTGGTEVSGGAYARQQVSGAIAAGGTWTTASTTITMGSSNPGWVVAGMNVYDATAVAQIGTVSSYTSTTLTLTSTAAHASSGSTDSLVFSAWPAASASSGTEPAVTPASVTNGAAITFPQTTASWGTVLWFGLYDAATSGNYLGGDYLSISSGTGIWQPFTVTSASPGVLTAHAHGFSNGYNVIITTKYGGTLPTFSQSNFTGPLVVAGATTDTFTVTNASTAVNTSSTGDGLVRSILEQSIPINVTPTFAASTLTLTTA